MENMNQLYTTPPQQIFTFLFLFLSRDYGMLMHVMHVECMYTNLNLKSELGAMLNNKNGSN